MTFLPEEIASEHADTCLQLWGLPEPLASWPVSTPDMPGWPGPTGSQAELDLAPARQLGANAGQLQQVEGTQVGREGSVSTRTFTTARFQGAQGGTSQSPVTDERTNATWAVQTQQRRSAIERGGTLTRDNMEGP